MSALTATTTDGIASINLTSGSDYGTVTIRAIVGGYKSDVEIEITDDDATGGNFARFGDSGGWSWETEIDRRERTGNETCTTVPNDGNEADGSVSGTRRLVDCDGNPLAGVVVTMNGATSRTDPDGYFTFSNGSSGANEITVGGVSYSFQISAEDSDARGGYRTICTDNETGEITYEGPA